MPAARCYSGSRDQVETDQKREYISVNGEAAFSTDDVVAMAVTVNLRITAPENNNSTLAWR